MSGDQASLPELVRDSKFEDTTFHGDLTIHTQPLGRRRRLEKWRRGDILGHGGYGVVMLQYKVDEDDAVDASSQRTRAVKMVRTRGQGPGYYVRELEALAKFSQAKYSEFFVEFLGWYESRDYINIAMEYCPHGDLKKYLLDHGGRLPEDQVKDIASQVLAGVVMMHRAGFANRDIKPANILIKSKPPEEWWVKVCDFGLSKRTEDFTSIATTVKGTPDFMPPELLGFYASGAQGTDLYMVDMWCLGETVFQVLTGQAVFGMPAAVGSYLQGDLGFPVHELQRINASSEAASFIQSLMRPWPSQRMTSEQAVGHTWMQDKALDAAVRAPSEADLRTISQSNGMSSPWPVPWHRAPGDQLTQASGQWTTTMAYSVNSPGQQQQERLGGSQGYFGQAEVPYMQPFQAAPNIQNARTPPVVVSTPTSPNFFTRKDSRTDSHTTYKTAKEVQAELKERIRRATQEPSENKPNEDAAPKPKPEPEKQSAPTVKKPEPVVAKAKEPVKKEAEKPVEPTNAAESEEDEFERIIREMEEAEAMREKEEEKRLKKREAEKQEAEKREAEKREAEREAEKREDEREAKRKAEREAEKQSTTNFEKPEPVVSKAKEPVKKETEKPAEPTKAAESEEDELERRNREMEDAEAEREKKKGEAEKAVQKAKDEEDRNKVAEEAQKEKRRRKSEKRRRQRAEKRRREAEESEAQFYRAL